MVTFSIIRNTVTAVYTAGISAGLSGKSIIVLTGSVL
jgi:hypothetical protein